MLKNYFPLVFVFLFLSNIYSQTTAIPDTNFEQALIDLGIDSDATINGSVLTADISGVNSLNVSTKNISDLTGIEDFAGLTSLDCRENQLVNLDISKNIALTDLECRLNQLTNLDVSKNIALTSLDCRSNQLTSLDVSQNTALEILTCVDNELTSLDVTQNTALISLYFNINQLTSIDVSQNTILIKLGCRSNQLSSLDISKNTVLTDLYCDNNQLSSLDLTQNTALKVLFSYNNQLSSLDVTQNNDLFYLSCSNNQLTSLNVKNGNNSLITTFNAVNNPSLTCVQVDNESDANAGIGPYSTWVKDATATYSEDCVTPSYVPTNGLVGFWPFEGNANDISGNDINGIVHSATLVNDRFGNLSSAYSFDNETATFGNAKDWIELPYTDKFNFTEFTISTWVYARNYYVTNTNNSIHYSALISRSDGGCNVGGSGLRFYTGPDGEFFSEVEGLNPNNAHAYNVVDLNRWTMLTMSYDGVSIKQYVDGVLVNEATSSGTIVPDPCNTFTFGESYMANGHWYNFDGVLDDIGMWNRALTSSEIETLYNENSLGIDDELLTQSINLYPNPVTNILTIDSEIPLTKVEIYSMLGKKVKEINSGFTSIRTRNLSNGVYIFKIYSENGIATKKLIKK